jgi:Transposase DDE domain
MLSDLPTHCAVGTKRNAKGHTTSWIGYKLHLDVADGDIPISAVLTSASLHDSQVAIPLATMTANRVTNLYDLMDSAYDAPEIEANSRALGHVPIIDRHPRSVPGGKEAIAAEARAQGGHRACRVAGNLRDSCKARLPATLDTLISGCRGVTDQLVGREALLGFTVHGEDDVVSRSAPGPPIVPSGLLGLGQVDVLGGRVGAAPSVSVPE